SYQVVKAWFVRFFVPNDVAVKRLQDADYSISTIRGSGGAVLSIGEGALWNVGWYAPAALDQNTTIRQFRCWIVDVSDIRTISSNGKRSRLLAANWFTAEYKDANRAMANLFDKILDSRCCF